MFYAQDDYGNMVAYEYDNSGTAYRVDPNTGQALTQTVNPTSGAITYSQPANTAPSIDQQWQDYLNTLQNPAIKSFMASRGTPTGDTALAMLRATRFEVNPDGTIGAYMGGGGANSVNPEANASYFKIDPTSGAALDWQVHDGSEYENPESSFAPYISAVTGIMGGILGGPIGGAIGGLAGDLLRSHLNGDQFSDNWLRAGMSTVGGALSGLGTSSMMGGSVFGGSELGGTLAGAVEPASYYDPALFEPGGEYYGAFMGESYPSNFAGSIYDLGEAYPSSFGGSIYDSAFNAEQYPSDFTNSIYDPYNMEQYPSDFSNSIYDKSTVDWVKLAKEALKLGKGLLGSEQATGSSGTPSGGLGANIPSYSQNASQTAQNASGVTLNKTNPMLSYFSKEKDSTDMFDPMKFTGWGTGFGNSGYKFLS
jgi:hypothetical protein